MCYLLCNKNKERDCYRLTLGNFVTYVQTCFTYLIVNGCTVISTIADSEYFEPKLSEPLAKCLFSAYLQRE